MEDEFQTEEEREERDSENQRKKDEFLVNVRKLPVRSVSLKCLKLLVTNWQGAMERYADEIDNAFIANLFPCDDLRFNRNDSAIYSQILRTASDYYRRNGACIEPDILKSKVLLKCSVLRDNEGTDFVKEYFDSFLNLEIDKPEDYLGHLDEIINHFRPYALARAYANDEYHRDEVLQKMNAINDRKRSKRNIIKLSDEYLDKVRDYKYEFIPTGWPELDEFLNGGAVRKGCNMFVAPTGTGKTTFAVSVSYQMAVAGYRVLHVNLECLAEQVTSKMAKPIDRNPDTKDTVYENYRFWSPDEEIGVPDIKAVLEREVRLGKPYDAIVLDSIDLLKQDPKLEAYRAEEQNANALKLLADNYNVVIWVTQQTNGEGLKLRSGESPTLYHLKGAKSVAHPMVSVLFLMRSEDQMCESKADVVLMKNRFGPYHWFHDITYDNASLSIDFCEHPDSDPLLYNPNSNFELYDNR